MRPWKHYYATSPSTQKPLCPAHNCLCTASEQGAKRKHGNCYWRFNEKCFHRDSLGDYKILAKSLLLQLYQVVCQWLAHVATFLVDYITQKAQENLTQAVFLHFVVDKQCTYTLSNSLHNTEVLVSHYKVLFFLEKDSKCFSKAPHPLFCFFCTTGTQSIFPMNSFPF